MADFTDLIDLAAERLGGAVLSANDEFFAPKEALLKASKPEWKEGLYTERGKWMDGWETRRRREPGEDWAVIRLGAPGVVKGVVIDTAFFTGNFPESAVVEACEVEGNPPVQSFSDGTIAWTEILGRTKLKGDSKNHFAIKHAGRVTHLRLTIHPDGGVARLRVHGVVKANEEVLPPGELVDLAAMESGGWVVECSDMHYGHRQNLILPGRSTHMGDGWETRRRRGEGHEWTIVQLAAPGEIERVEVDTDHYRGNAPGSASVECCDVTGSFDASRAKWQTLVAQQPIQPHTRHRFAHEVERQVATHVRLNIFPDGGVARLRVIGRIPGP
ncbi:MAG: allantoicase [Gemmatimonadetes bacterium]|nr:allantoicase [Gemmatimonadota bacterium]